VGEIAMAVRLRDAEYDTVVRLIASPLIQRHEIMCRPGSFVSPSVFENRIKILPALRTTAVLPDVSRILGVVVKLHLFALICKPEGPCGQHSRVPSSSPLGRWRWNPHMALRHQPSAWTYSETPQGRPSIGFSRRIDSSLMMIAPCRTSGLRATAFASS